MVAEVKRLGSDISYIHELGVALPVRSVRTKMVSQDFWKTTVPVIYVPIGNVTPSGRLDLNQRRPKADKSVVSEKH